MEVTIDGVGVFYRLVGPEDNYPLILLHGGPGVDHTSLHPWLDPLADTFRLIYVDLRGQGRSERVDPATLSLRRFAQDVTQLVEKLELDRYALLGHSFGAFIALTHAVEEGGASHYVISSGSASMSQSMREVHDNLAAFEPLELREQVTQSWAMEPNVNTQEDVSRVMTMQMPFHFARSDTDAYRKYVAASESEAVYSPEVLAYFAANEYEIELEDRLHEVSKPCLIVTGEQDRTCTPRAARDMAAGIPGSELVVLPQAGHMTFVEQPSLFYDGVRSFFLRHRENRADS